MNKEEICTEFMNKFIDDVERTRKDYYDSAAHVSDEDLAASLLRTRNNLTQAISIIRETWGEEFGDDDIDM